jgi:hypothetical protein
MLINSRIAHSSGFADSDEDRQNNPIMMFRGEFFTGSCCVSVNKILGGCWNRGEAQVLRLSMIYALLDGHATIELSHLKCAVACWEYCEDSAKFIFSG